MERASVDKLLVQAYNKEIVCSGLSAGSYCWFKYNYDWIEGLGIINTINCVHYEQKDTEARNKLYNVIKEKLLTGIALEVVDDDIKIIKSNKDRNAYIIRYLNNEIIEEIMK